MKRLYRIFKIKQAGKLPLCKRIAKYGYILREFYAPLPQWQVEHNTAVDFKIAEAEREYQEYIKDCKEKKTFPGKCKRQIVAIRYI